MERFCADPVAKSVNHPPPSRGRGQLVSRSAGAAGRVLVPVKSCCKCRNRCHNKQLGQQLPPFWVVNATTAYTALVQLDERRREGKPQPLLWPSVPVVVVVLRWLAAAPLAVPGLAWSAVALEVGPMQSAGTDRRG